MGPVIRDVNYGGRDIHRFPETDNREEGMAEPIHEVGEASGGGSAGGSWDVGDGTYIVRRHGVLSQWVALIIIFEVYAREWGYHCGARRNHT